MRVRILKPRLAICVVGIALLTAGSCGDPQLPLAPVTGILTVNGKPIERAEVVLSWDQPSAQGPRPSTRGVTDESGRFTLRTLTPQKQLLDGAVVGTHRVTVTTRIVDQDSRGATRVVRPELLAPKYTTGQALTVEVPPAGIEELRFDLPAG